MAQESARYDFSVELLLNNLPGMVYRCKLDAHWTMEFMSSWVKELTGYRADQLMGNNELSYAQLIDPADLEYVAGGVQQAVDTGKPFQLTYRINDAFGMQKWVRERGQAVYDENRKLIALEGFITDVTEYKHAEARLERLATYDDLTGLPNRTFLNGYLQEVLADPKRNEPLAVMFIDLDEFKQVNDTMGHTPGDMLLRQVALRLQQVMRPDDVVARLGGDEFVVTASCLNGTNSAQIIAQKILSALRVPFIIEGQEVFVSASIGISMAPQDGRTTESLFKSADMAMYRAKKAGRNGFRFFEMEMGEVAKARSALDNALPHALERNEFELQYQPRIDLNTMRVTGMEALIRWNHPELGRVPPLQFIPIAEDSGIIGTIGKWVLEEACAQTKRLNDQLNYPLRISVNLSAKQLKLPDLTEQVQAVLRKTALPPQLLELELTETALIEDMELSAITLKELKCLGVMLAIDDFGTGYSGLAYLQRFPFDVLKLDRTFLMENTDNKNRFKFIKAVLDLAHSLELAVVAEGIETQEILDVLLELSCDEGQGYLFAKPLSLDKLEVFLASSLGER
jgi:diguanylate cyclase (GGDEF)-like protein/PAS domain S-box-containing protein